jgi:hypothetical protein
VSRSAKPQSEPRPPSRIRRAAVPSAVAVLVFGLSWFAAWWASGNPPSWLSIGWSTLLSPLVIAAVFGLAAGLVALLMRTPRERGGTVGRWLGALFRFVVTVATVAVLSWSLGGLRHEPHAGEWIGLGVGLLLGLLTWFLLWEWRRRRHP